MTNNLYEPDINGYVGSVIVYIYSVCVFRIVMLNNERERQGERETERERERERER